MKKFILGYLILINLNAFSQIEENFFEKLSRTQDSLMIEAYNQGNVKNYNKNLNILLSKYDELSNEEKSIYSNVLANCYYNFSCLYAIKNNKQKAILYLKKSVDKGYTNYDHLQVDPDFDNIRSSQEFIEFNSYFRKIADYPFILKKAKKYDTTDVRITPNFTYQSKNDTNLIALRKAFNLDSIAGKGDEILTILNLMHWLHNLIPHDGIHGNPKERNAINMIKTCKIESRGINCRGLAIVLNECYLAMGIKSRIVTCLPKDSLKLDTDCHVINMVFSETLKKWLWIDPTFNAYVMNEKGELLSIEEVRESLIENKPLILNPDANWNNQITQTKEQYLMHYMAKNLYKIECPLNSEYNMETNIQNKTHSYVSLLPIDQIGQKQDTITNYNKENNSTWIYYKTNNPKLFWAKP